MLVELGAYALLATVYYLLEVGWSIVSDGLLPAGVPYYGAGYAVILAWTVVAGGGYRLLRRRFARVGLWIGFGGSLAVVLGKLWLMAGRGAFSLTALYLAGGWILAGLWSRRDFGTRAGTWPGVLLVGSGLISTDVLKVVWFHTRDGSSTAVMTGVGVSLVLGGMIAALRWGWPTCQRRLRGRGFLLAYRVVGLVGTAAAFSILVPDGAWEGWTKSRESTVDRRVRERLSDRVRRASRAPAEKLPNVIVISVDTLRWDMVPPRAGKHGLTLPNLRRLRRDSLAFPRAFSVSSWTLPAHASLFTGLTPVGHGAVRKRISIDSSVRLYPEFLNDLGYRTAAFTDGGFLSRRYGFGRGHDVYWEQNPPLPVRVGSGYRGFVPGGVEHWILLAGAPPSLEGTIRTPRASPTPRRQRRRQLVFFRRNANRARHWLKTHAGGSRPFYLFLHTFQVHDYWKDYPRAIDYLRERHPELHRASWNDTGGGSPEEREPGTPEGLWEGFTIPGRHLSDDHVDRFRRRLRELSPRHRERFRAILRYLAGRGKPFHRHGQRKLQGAIVSLPDSGWRRLRGDDFQEWFSRDGGFRGGDRFRELRKQVRLRILYQRGIRAVDRQLGSFLRFLKDRGLYETSVIVFLSDHGEGFKLETPARSHDKGQLHEVLLKIPLWIKLPHGRRAGTSTETRVPIEDVFPIVFRETGIVPREEDRAGPAVVPGRGLPLYARDRRVVRGSIHTFSLFWDEIIQRSREERRGRYFVHDGSLKMLRDSWNGDRRFFEVHPESVVEFPAEPVTSSRRRRLTESMNRFRRTLRRYPDPYTRPSDPLGSDLGRRLKGLGYVQ